MAHFSSPDGLGGALSTGDLDLPVATWVIPAGLGSMKEIPPQLLGRPISRIEAMRSGISPRVLEGTRFVRLFPQVYCCREHEMTEGDWVTAAKLALPSRARLTGISRIQTLGLDFGPRRPLRFVMEGDVHPHIDGIFLHRTKKLAPVDEEGITPAGAFVSYCRSARVIDAIKVGDWLLHHGHTTRCEIRELACAAPWRDGAMEALWILDHLNGASRSLKESETRSVIVFAGLPEPEVNQPVPLADSTVVIADLQYKEWRTIVEYEGAQHQDDRGQYVSDIGRYALLRREGKRYVQVTQEKLRFAQGMVCEIHRELVAAGYDGPAPEFGPRWQMLFARVHDVLAHDRALARLSRRAVG